MRRLTHEYLLSVLDYDPETGVFIWMQRPDVSRHWNTRYAGKQAGTVVQSSRRMIAVNKRVYPAAHLAWFYVYRQWPDRKLTHVNGDRDDNAIGNIRPAGRLPEKKNQFYARVEARASTMSATV